MLQDGRLDPFSNKRHAVIVIRGEKEICHFYIELARVVQDLITTTLHGGVDAQGRSIDSRVRSSLSILSLETLETLETLLILSLS